jgi:hypothetical protein
LPEVLLHVPGLETSIVLYKLESVSPFGLSALSYGFIVRPGIKDLNLFSLLSLMNSSFEGSGERCLTATTFRAV